MNHQIADLVGEAVSTGVEWIGKAQSAIDHLKLSLAVAEPYLTGNDHGEVVFQRIIFVEQDLAKMRWHLKQALAAYGGDTE